jgi:Tat protein secretion system quality control protein TatD with DNase activity
MVHSWSGAPEMVDRAVSLGLHLSFSASVTRSPRVAAAVRRVPGSRLLVETDCPDQPVSPGTRGEPSDLLEVARHVAALRGEAPERVLERAADAARDLFPAVAKAS